MHPSNQTFVTGGNDSIIAMWDFEELLCSGTFIDNMHPVRQLSFSPCGTFLAAICNDDRIENAKKFLLEVFDTETRVRVALPPANISSQTKTSLDWSPRESERPVLAIAGLNENSQGIVHLLQLNSN